MSGVAALVGAGMRGRRRGGLVATFLVLVLSSVAIVAGLVVRSQGAVALDRAAGDASVAHLVLYGTPQALATAAAQPDVVASAGPFPSLSDVELPLADETVPIEVIARDSPDSAVERAPLAAGRWASTADEVVLDRSLGEDLGIGVGDSISLRYHGTSVGLRVVGTAVNLTDCWYPQCDPGRLWVTSAGFARFDAGAAAYSQAYLRFADPAEADPFVERLSAAGLVGIGGSDSWLDTRGDFLALDRVFGAFVAAFGGFVLVVSAVIVAGSTAMRVVARRRDVGLLGALGATPRQLALALVAENLVIGVVAALAGWGLAGLLAPSLQIGVARALGVGDPSWPLRWLVVCVLVVSALLAAATVVPARSAARRPVTDVLRDVPPTRVSAINRRTAHVPGRLELMGAQEVASRPGRSALAALAIAVAVVGSVVSFGFVSAFDLVTTDARRAGDPWDVALDRGDVAPATVERAIAGAPEVERWFSEVERRSTFREGAFLAVATGGAPAGAAYDVAGGHGITQPGEAIVGWGFLRRFGVHVGDRVRFLAGAAPIDVRIVGWYRDTEDSGEIMRFRLEDLVVADPSAQPDVYRLSIRGGADAATVGARLAESLGPSARSEVLDTGRSDMQPLFLALRLVALVLLATAAVNLFATLATAARESVKLTGVRLALGFTPRQLVTDGATGGAVLGVVAVVVGVPVGLLTFRLLADTVSRGIGVGPGWMPLPGFVPTSLISVTALVTSTVLGGVAVRRLAHRPAAELVRAE